MYKAKHIFFFVAETKYFWVDLMLIGMAEINVYNFLENEHRT